MSIDSTVNRTIIASYRAAIDPSIVYAFDVSLTTTSFPTDGSTIFATVFFSIGSTIGTTLDYSEH